MNTEFDICDIVEYAFAGRKPTKWRITNFQKRIPAPEDMPPAKFANEKEEAVSKIIADISKESLEKERTHRKSLGLPHTRRYRLVYCSKEEATHASLVAVCGATALLSELKKIGVVEWSEKMIKQNKESANWYINQNFFPDYEWE